MLTATDHLVIVDALVQVAAVPDIPPTALADVVSETNSPTGTGWALTNPQATSPPLRQLFVNWEANWVQRFRLGSLSLWQKLLIDADVACPGLFTVSPDAYYDRRTVTTIKTAIPQLQAAFQAASFPGEALQIISADGLPTWSLIGDPLETTVLGRSVHWTLTITADGLELVTADGRMPINGWTTTHTGTRISDSPHTVDDDLARLLHRLGSAPKVVVRPVPTGTAYVTALDALLRAVNAAASRKTTLMTETTWSQRSTTPF